MNRTIGDRCWRRDTIILYILCGLAGQMNAPIGQSQPSTRPWQHSGAGNMPFGIINHVLTKYPVNDWFIYRGTLIRYGIGLLVLYGLRRWCAGGRNQALRRMASRVVIVTVNRISPVGCTKAYGDREGRLDSVLLLLKIWQCTRRRLCCSCEITQTHLRSSMSRTYVDGRATALFTQRHAISNPSIQSVNLPRNGLIRPRLDDSI